MVGRRVSANSQICVSFVALFVFNLSIIPNYIKSKISFKPESANKTAWFYKNSSPFWFDPRKHKKRTTIKSPPHHKTQKNPNSPDQLPKTSDKNPAGNSDAPIHPKKNAYFYAIFKSHQYS
jgi:hypothetical protein